MQRVFRKIYKCKYILTLTMYLFKYFKKNITFAEISVWLLKKDTLKG